MKQDTVIKDNIDSQEEVDSKDILRILEKHNEDRGGLIAILEEIQAEYGYLPEESLRIVSNEIGRPLVDVYSVATFYRSFSLQPQGKHLVCACLGTAWKQLTAWGRVLLGRLLLSIVVTSRKSENQGLVNY
jgi:NADH:ubiquinone oxidoreductase subunit E